MLQQRVEMVEGKG